MTWQANRPTLLAAGLGGRTGAPARISKLFAATILAATTLLAMSATAFSSGAGAAASSKAPIVVGGIVAASEFPGVTQGFQARIARANRQGGIGGRKIDFIGDLDDNNSPSTDLTDAQKLILDNHVAAIAPVATDGFTSPTGDFAVGKNTPFVGFGINSPFCGATNKSGWGFNGCLVGSAVYNSSLFEPIIKKLGNKQLRIAIVSNSNAEGQGAAQVFGTVLPLLHQKVVLNSTTTPIAGVTDYSPLVTQLMGAHPDLVVYSISYTETVALIAAMKAAGYTGAGMDFQAYSPGSLAQQPSLAATLQGEYIDIQVPPQESGSPALKQASKDLVSSGQPALLSIGNQWGYWSADVLIQMLQAAQKAGQPLTGAGLEQTVNHSGFTYTGTLAGGVGPNTFTKSENAPVPCAGLVQVSGTKYKVAEPFKCYSNIPAK